MTLRPNRFITAPPCWCVCVVCLTILLTSFRHTTHTTHTTHNDSHYASPNEFPSPQAPPESHMFAVLCLVALFAAAAAPGVVARGFSQQPEDIYAWPKYKVSFLNGLPVLNHTAQRWLQDGLRGGEKEFLGLEWTTDPQSAPLNLKSIDPGDIELLATSAEQLADVDPPNHSATPSPKLQHMRLGPSNEFLCLILPPPEVPPYTDDTLHPPVPTRTWELLQPLQDTCLYVCPQTCISSPMPWFLISSATHMSASTRLVYLCLLSQPICPPVSRKGTAIPPRSVWISFHSNRTWSDTTHPRHQRTPGRSKRRRVHPGPCPHHDRTHSGRPRGPRSATRSCSPREPPRVGSRRWPPLSHPALG